MQESKDDQYKKLNIDPAVAAKGKVDFVRVESWGDEGGAEPDLENLKMKTFSSGFDASDYSAPFFEQLVRRIQLLESKVDILYTWTTHVMGTIRYFVGAERFILSSCCEAKLASCLPLQQPDACVPKVAGRDICCPSTAVATV